MIEFLNSWAEQIVLAVIVATIIELLLPNNKNRKYIQMVIGIYVLFNIISPIIKEKEVFSFSEYVIEENMVNTNSVIDQSSMDKRLEKIYLEELEKNVINKFEENGYTVKKCSIDAELDTNKKNAGIHLITVKLAGSVNEVEVEKLRTNLAEEYEIEQEKIKIVF